MQGLPSVLGGEHRCCVLGSGGVVLFNWSYIPTKALQVPLSFRSGVISIAFGLKNPTRVTEGVRLSDSLELDSWASS